MGFWGPKVGKITCGRKRQNFCSEGLPTSPTVIVKLQLGYDNLAEVLDRESEKAKKHIFSGK